MKEKTNLYNLTTAECELIAIIRALAKERCKRSVLITIKPNQFEVQPIGNRPHTLQR